jgi:hypothetical protein
MRMTLTGPAADTTTPPAGVRTWLWTLLVAIGVGLAVAVVIVYAYYNDPWRPLAHTLGPWAVLATAVGFRRPPPLAIGASISFLAAGVVTFYVGLTVGHDVRWGGTGSVMSIHWEQIGLWLVLAAVAGGWLRAAGLLRSPQELEGRRGDGRADRAAPGRGLPGPRPTGGSRTGVRST